MLMETLFYTFNFVPCEIVYSKETSTVLSFKINLDTSSFLSDHESLSIHMIGVSMVSVLMYFSQTD